MLMTATDPDLAAMVQTLEQSREYRVLRRLPLRQSFSTPTEPTKVGILLDVETTGLDTASDEAVELGMVKFSYHSDGTRRKTVRIWAERSPFELKDELKKRGYRWSSGDEGRPSLVCRRRRSPPRRRNRVFRKSIYLRDVDLFTQTLSAFDRFSIRI
jgi:hypothetical protein